MAGWKSYKAPRFAPGDDLEWPKRIALPAKQQALLDGATLLDLLSVTLDQYVSIPPHANTAVAIWTLATHCLDIAMVDAVHDNTEPVARFSPILALTSPGPRFGKTTVLTLLSKLVYRPLSTANITSAALFRVMHKSQPTMLIDEADSFMRSSSELRNILNSGHSRDLAYVIRVTPDGPRKFSTWGCKAIALIGNLPATVADRSIIIPMRRKAPQESLMQIRDAGPTRFENLARGCVGFGQTHVHKLLVARPSFPDQLHDRARDNWEFLFTIADVAGGDWPAKARAAAIALTSTVLRAGTVELLDGIRRAFDQSGADRLRTEFLLTTLAKDERRPVAHFRRDLSPETQLAGYLGQFGIAPKTLRFGKATFKGYRRHDFVGAFGRYLEKGVTA